MGKIKIITDENGERCVVMSYGTFEKIQRQRARRLGLDGMDPETRASLIEIEAEQWAEPVNEAAC